MTPRPAVELEVAWFDGPGSTSPRWYPIDGADLLDWSFRMGRSAATDDTTQPGTATFVLDNRNRTYDPTNTAAHTGLGPTPGRPVRLRITWDGGTRTLWQGIVGPAGFEQDNYRHKLSEAVINCVDLMGHADRVAVSGVFPAARTLEQAQDVLNAAGLSVIKTITSDAWDEPVMWDTPARVWGDLGRFSETFDGGRVPVPAVLEPIDSVAAYLRDVELTDGGRIYFDPVRGELVGMSYQESRLRFRSRVAQWTISDEEPRPVMLTGPTLSGSLTVGGTLTVDGGVWVTPVAPYRFDDIKIETLPLRNDVTVTVSDGEDPTSVRELDEQSIVDYGRGSTSMTLLSTLSGDAEQIAAYQVARYGQPVQVVSQLRLNPAGSSAAWPLVYGLELFDRVTVVRTPHNVGQQVAADYLVEGLAMTAGAGVEQWTLELYLSPVATDTLALWDDSTTPWDDPRRHWGL